MRHSLRRKAVFLIILIMLLITAAGVFASVKAINDIIRSSYESRATETAQTAASVIDTEELERFRQKTDKIFASLEDDQRVGSEEWGSDAFNAYQARYEDLYDTEEYQSLLTQLQKVQDANTVDCLYTAYVDPKTETFIYLVDADHDEPCPIGCCDPVYEENQEVLTNPSRGFPAYVTNTPEYGHLVTAGVPVYNDKKEVIAYALTDISMNDMIAWRNRMIGIMLFIQLGLTILIGIFAGIAVNRAVVRPINELSRASEEYCQESDLTNHTRFAALNVNTKDEIETLSNSMKQMEQDLNGKIADLLDTTDRLAETRREADELNILAKKDSMTGVYNKRSFDEALQRLDQALHEGGEEPFAIAIIDLNDLKHINDTYGHEQGDVAITSLCRNICQVFVHSPVYRIGGDEFAVILQGQDLGRIDELMTSFNSRLATLQQNADLQPWEKAGAAIGYARFHFDRDNDASATFRRADQAMYERKETMKNSRG